LSLAESHPIAPSAESEVSAALEVEGISHSYAVRRSRRTAEPSGNEQVSNGRLRALDNVRFTVGRAEIFGLLGPNGGGKTTLFKVLSTAMRPQSGTALVLGDDLVSRPDAVRRSIGVVFQNSSVDVKLTATENMRHQGHLYGMRGAGLERAIRRLLERVGLLDRADDLVETLSGGQRRRVELAKGLLHEPRLLLLDEPTTGLDPVARREMWAYLNVLRASDGISVLVTTHLMEEAENCDRLAIIDHGRLVALGAPDELKRDIEGDVLLIEATDPESVRRELNGRFHMLPQVVGRTLRIERENAGDFVPVLLQTFGPQIQSVTIARPTLEDVFIHRTGHKMTDES
jgi:ABC-2 type transport system ATP-binding protein